MRTLSLCILAYLLIAFSPTAIFAQEEYPPDTMQTETWEEDSMYTDEEYIEEEPETVKGILKQGADNAKEMGKETLNQITDQAVDQAGQFLQRSAQKFFDNLKLKISGKNKDKEEAAEQEGNIQPTDSIKEAPMEVKVKKGGG